MQDGEKVVGKKIGVTSKAVQDMLGVHQPDFGFLTDWMHVEGDIDIDAKALIAPRAEAEIAFILKSSLNGPGVTAADVMAATESIAPCFEIVDSRIDDWKIAIVDTVADNASCGVYVVGKERLDPAGLDLPNLHVAVTKNGEPLSEGYGHAVQGDPRAGRGMAREHARCTRRDAGCGRRDTLRQPRSPRPCGEGRPFRNDLEQRQRPPGHLRRQLRVRTSRHDPREGRDHRFGQYRHRPDDEDDQVPAEHGAGHRRRHRRESEGLAMAREHGIATTHEGLEGLRRHPLYKEIGIAFDATSAYAHKVHDEALRADGIQVVDLTPAAIGPFTVPPVNMSQHLDQPNVNMVTCGGQATIPMVAAVARVSDKVHYAEIVASVSSRSAGPGTRANIDEFTRTTARAIEVVGGATRGKAIIILNPAEPPMIMRDTVFTLSEGADEDQIRRSVADMVAEVQKYVPGYRLKQEVQFERFGDNNKLKIPGQGEFTGIKSMIMLEVEGAGDYLPSYSGNLDIMTAAAKATGELLAARRMAAA